MKNNDSLKFNPLTGVTQIPGRLFEKHKTFFKRAMIAGGVILFLKITKDFYEVKKKIDGSHKNRLFEEEQRFAHKIQELNREHELKVQQINVEHERRLQEHQCKAGWESQKTVIEYDVRMKEKWAEFELWKLKQLPTVPSVEQQPTMYSSLSEQAVSYKSSVGQNQYYPNTLIPQGNITMPYGPTGAGKSVILMQIGKTFATGENVGLLPDKGVKGVPQRVKFYNPELNNAQLKDRLGECPANMQVTERHVFNTREELEKDIEEFVFGSRTDCCVIVDSASVAATQNMTSEVDVKRFYKTLHTYIDRAEKQGFLATFVIGAHSVKTPNGDPISDMAGSKFWAIEADEIFGLIPDQQGLLKMVNPKDRNGTKNRDLLLRFEKEPNWHFVCADDDYLTAEELGEEDFLEASPKKVEENKMPKIALVTPEIAWEIHDLSESTQSKSCIAKHIVEKYEPMGDWGKFDHTQVTRILEAVQGGRYGTRPKPLDPSDVTKDIEQ